MKILESFLLLISSASVSYRKAAAAFDKITRLIIACLCLSLLFQNCKKENVSANSTERTVLIYMAANNDLSEEASKSFEAIKAGAKDLPGTLLVLLKTGSEDSYLMKFNSSSNNIDTLKIYHGNNTSDPAFLSKVIAESKLFAPANSYGLVFWSHATSWAPASRLFPNAVGSDGGSEMDLKDFKNALQDNLDFIMFDACSMASIEAIYELRNKANYILASPSEVLSSSYPYQSIIPLLFGGPDDLKRVGEKFVQYYDTLSGVDASATVSLINTKELNKLAELTKQLLSKTLPDDGFQRNKIQKLNFDYSSKVDAFDFLDFFDKNYAEEEFLQIKEQLEKTIIYKDHTSTFLGNPIKTFSGLSIYLPVPNDQLRDYYCTFSWAMESSWNQLFK